MEKKIELKRNLKKAGIGTAISVIGTTIAAAAKTNKIRRFGVCIALYGHGLNWAYHYIGLSKETNRLAQESCNNLEKFLKLHKQVKLVVQLFSETDKLLEDLGEFSDNLFDEEKGE